MPSFGFCVGFQKMCFSRSIDFKTGWAEFNWKIYNRRICQQIRFSHSALLDSLQSGTTIPLILSSCFPTWPAASLCNCIHIEGWNKFHKQQRAPVVSFPSSLPARILCAFGLRLSLLPFSSEILLKIGAESFELKQAIRTGLDITAWKHYLSTYRLLAASKAIGQCLNRFQELLRAREVVRLSLQLVEFRHGLLCFSFVVSRCWMRCQGLGEQAVPVSSLPSGNGWQPGLGLCNRGRLLTAILSIRTAAHPVFPRPSGMS